MTTQIPDSLLAGGGGGGGGSGSVATDTIFDAKGDLPVGTGSNTAAKLATGSNGQILTVDTSTGTGLKWATPTVYGNASGPASAVNNRVAFFDGTTGKLIKDSGLTLSGNNTGDQVISDATISTSDITTGNATVAKHGFLPKLSGVAGEYLAADGTWSTPAGGGGGGGDASGPASATDNAVARFNTTTGKLIQNSGVIIDDSNNVSGLGTLNTHTIPGGTGTIALTSQITGTNSGTNTGDQDLSGYLTKAANLSGLASASASRTSLGLKNAAIRDITFSTGAASGGADGDLWFTYTP